MGGMDEAKGRVKEAAGDLTDDDKLKQEGKLDQAAGKAKGTIHDLEEKAEDLVDKVKDKLRSEK